MSRGNSTKAISALLLQMDIRCKDVLFNFEPLKNRPRRTDKCSACASSFFFFL